MKDERLANPERLRLQGLVRASRWRLLPSVWSNVLLGWGIGLVEVREFPVLGLAGSLYFIAGMWWNDAWDAEEDRKLGRLERPVVEGLVSSRFLGWSGAVGIILATLILLFAGGGHWLYGLALGGCIGLYTATHQRFAWSAIVMGMCRAFLILMAAGSWKAELWGIPVMLPALVILIYVSLLTFRARKEGEVEGRAKSTRKWLRRMPALDALWWLVLIAAWVLQ